MQAVVELAESLREPPPSDDALGDAYVAALSRLLERDPGGALDGLLSIVARDKKWGDEAARRAMLAIFQLIGVRSEVSDAYRKKLALLL
jgi:putative thioredoxin